ncbi:MAG TPA: HD domain-containing phosphohydrolase [Polyangiaceae bacterium]|nr:HD domain-containing phosphohydrolase [Polyangiaceae bacterium]
MTTAPTPKLLCVDDEPFVLEGLTLHLRRTFKLSTAPGGAQGLQILEKEGPFAVVMSDMRMPGMNGAEFLTKVKERWPDTTRVLLTGHADLESAISAVNDGQIFRFLTKPCPPNVLLPVLVSAAKQYELITGERVLLEQTLHGAVKTLTDVLSLANPSAFGRASRAKQLMTQLLAQLQKAHEWQCEVSAMLSQIGCVTIPVESLERMYGGQHLTDDETAMMSRLPSLAERLIAHIPRLEEVRQILLHMDAHFEPEKPQTLRGEAIPFGARALKIILDFLVFESQLGSAANALNALRGRKGAYDPTIFQAFAETLGNVTGTAEVRQLSVKELRQGMVLHENVVTKSGMLLMSKGHEVTTALLERITNFSRNTGVREPILVVINNAPSPKLRATS